MLGELGESNLGRHVRSIAVAHTQPPSAAGLPMARLRKRLVDAFPDCVYGGGLAAAR
ncbi:hypothetical protein G4G28_22335 [Massilia sp. Dwa41.01b]|uniref:hypothetical protein n=1 Tax=unclassified Massilia TaxID=2609279 RepID=UPI001600932B|nr:MULTISPECIES: hypothetical protein [unclassified Massilia]QNA90554.1 hypothetical protein G4G28_22335 [Massilia sp. Dwa41.01b]QNA97785.1 hypothetical protein G4G31_01415 [Massilia sp. Se16.2.3]